MPTPTSSKRSTIEFLLTVVVLYFLTSMGLKFLFPQYFGGQAPLKEVRLSMESSSVREGNDPVVVITNATEKELALPKRCPAPPVDIAFIETKADGSESHSDLIPNDSVLPCEDVPAIAAGKSHKINLAGWKYSAFSRLGTYELSLELPENLTQSGASTISTRFSLKAPGVFTKIFRTFVSEPLFNALIFIAAWTPGHNLGIAIILLTVLVKLALLLPNKHALEGQKKLQALQPKMEEIKRKYADDNTRIQEETMKLWKEMKINPLQSCLPTLLQLPILIGLFFVIRDGAHLSTMQHLLYSPYKALPPDFFGTTLVGIDLLKPEMFFAPALLVLLQFLQMKMMMGRKKAGKEIIVKPVGKKSWMPELDQQTVMMYILPLMIGYFAIKFPLAVSLYWGVSTLFAIVQQWFVLHEREA